MKDSIASIEKSLLDAGRLCKSAGFADPVRATVASLRDVDSRLAALEKRAVDEMAARFGFGDADTSQARIAQLEEEIAGLRASDSSAGLAKTLARSGLALSYENTEGQPDASPRQISRL
jgi:hypothetical protein